MKKLLLLNGNIFTSESANSNKIRKLNKIRFLLKSPGGSEATFKKWLFFLEAPQPFL